MNKKLKNIIKKLKENNMTISTMESCTGGGLANAITNIPGASEIIYFCAVTYSNEYKVKMGVPKEVIDKYSVYSIQTAECMAKSISEFADSSLGVGITGKLGIPDKNNDSGDDDAVFICIYDKSKDIYNNLSMKVNSEDRKDDKLEIIEKIIDFLYDYV